MKAQNPCILLVDDSDTDLKLIVRAFRKNEIHALIHCLTSGNQAISYLKGEHQFSDRTKYPYPSFIMTDLKMSDGDGFSVLEILKNNPLWCIIPTIVLSGSSDTDDIKKSYQLGACSYFVKPSSFVGLYRLIGRLYGYWEDCEVPEINESGEMLKTESNGKLGERFSQE
jgi:two-component system, response regulator